jgi:hypothetical protein
MPLFATARRLLGGTQASSRRRAPLLPTLPARPAPAPRRPRRGGLPLVFSLAIAAAACAAQAPVALPRKSHALAAHGALASPTLTPRQQVIAAYTGYWQAFAAAMSSQNAARARAILAPYEPPGAISQAVRADRRVWAAHESGYGSAVTHVLSVQLTGNRALVHDCLDLSHFGAQNVRTGRVVPESFGLPHLNFYITVLRSRAGWLVTNMQPVEVPCGP